MRQVADRDLIHRFMRALATETYEDTRVYFTGGATAVLYGWRGSTIDRGHSQDLDDVQEMLSRGLIDRDRGLEYFAAVGPFLYRYPSLDPRALQAAVDEAFRLP